MAKEAKKDPQELTVEQKLKALFQLQTMLSKIDEIKTLRGELPLEVQDLEDEIAGLSTRIDRIKAEVAELKSSIAGKKVEIETAKASVAKYKDQQDNVRNNREYDFLSKEIEFQTLEIELCEKRIKEFAAQEEEKSQEVAESNAALEERQKDLDVKKSELDEIISETKQEEEKLRDKAKELETKIEPRLLQSFKRIRKNSRNGLGIVYVQRDAWGKRQHHGLLARQRQGRGSARDDREARRRARGRWGGAPGTAHPDRTARERKDGRYVTHSEQSATCGVPEGLGRFAYKNHVQFG